MCPCVYIVREYVELTENGFWQRSNVPSCHCRHFRSTILRRRKVLASQWVSVNRCVCLRSEALRVPIMVFAQLALRLVHKMFPSASFVPALSSSTWLANSPPSSAAVIYLYPLGLMCSRTQLCHIGVFNDYIKQLHVSAFSGHLQVVLREQT